jgi:hypothetical protein
MADILPINTWFCFDFVSSVHRVPFNNVQLQVYIIKIKIVIYTQLSQLSHISLELSKHNIITMCCHTIYLGKKCFFHIISKKNALLEKHHFYLSDMRTPVVSGVRVTRSLVVYVYFVDRCLSFCTFSFGHCVVCSSSIYWFWLPLWYHQTLLALYLNIYCNIIRQIRSSNLNQVLYHHYSSLDLRDNKKKFDMLSYKFTNIILDNLTFIASV